MTCTKRLPARVGDIARRLWINGVASGFFLFRGGETELQCTLLSGLAPDPE
jgi:hypothetical protein